MAIALPFLDIMRPARASAQQAEQRFVAFFAPNGTDPPSWNPRAGTLDAANLPVALQDMPGYAAEGEWPASRPSRWREDRSYQPPPRLL